MSRTGLHRFRCHAVEQKQNLDMRKLFQSGGALRSELLRIELDR
jgi:hypothetical protein